MKILSDISPMLNEVTENTLLAHSDAYPDYQRTLSCQFDGKTFMNMYQSLSSTYNLNIDYFQTGIMLYDTSLIEENTFNELLTLAYKYPICNTNEQGIINLHFNCTKKVWKQICVKNEHTNFYDFCSRDINDTNYIIVKNKNW